MFSNTLQTNNTIKKVKKIYTIDRSLAERFKQVADKDMRKMSQIVESSIRRYVESRSS